MAGSAQEVQIQTGWFTPEVNKMPQMATTSQRWDMIEMTNTTSLDMIKLQVWNVDGVLGSHILIHDMICIHMCYMYVHIYIYIYMPLKYMRVYIYILVNSYLLFTERVLAGSRTVNHPCAYRIWKNRIKKSCNSSHFLTMHREVSYWRCFRQSQDKFTSKSGPT